MTAINVTMSAGLEKPMKRSFIEWLVRGILGRRLRRSASDLCGVDSGASASLLSLDVDDVSVAQHLRYDFLASAHACRRLHFLHAGSFSLLWRLPNHKQCRRSERADEWTSTPPKLNRKMCRTVTGAGPRRTRTSTRCFHSRAGVPVLPRRLGPRARCVCL